MIQATELRVGNLLKDYKHKLQYVEVHTINRYDHTQCKVTEHDSGYVYECSLEDLRPIKLTPEILEKVGFNHHYEKGDGYHVTESEWWAIKAGKGLWGKNEILIVRFEEGLTYSSHATRAECKYVHQLQNLFYFLTSGEELNIQL